MSYWEWLKTDAHWVPLLMAVVSLTLSLTAIILSS